MKKIISIDGKDYTMKSSAYTQFAYKNMTGRSLLKDLQTLIDIADKIESDLSLLDKITEPILDIAFVMIQEADETQLKDKDDFYKSIDNMFGDYEWINNVISLAVSPYVRQLQNNINKS